MNNPGFDPKGGTAVLERGPATAPDAFGDFTTGVSHGIPQSQLTRLTNLHEVLARADTIAKSDYGPVHFLETSRGVMIEVGKPGESIAAAVEPSLASFVVHQGKVESAEIRAPQHFPKGAEQAVDAVIQSILHHLDAPK